MSRHAHWCPETSIRVIYHLIVAGPSQQIG